jgi:hypothetical protein
VKKTVYIFGDSWSVCSKIKKENFIEETGTQTFQDLFLKTNILVKNFSKEGASNFDIIKIIKSINLDLCDQLVVFQTDPLRDIVDRKKFKLSNTFNVDARYQDIDQVSEKMLNDFYQELSLLGKPILLVGGLSKVFHNCNFTNIDIFPKSWTELVDSQYKDCYYEWVEFTELVHHFLELNTDLTPIKNKIYEKNNIWQTSDAFGWCHPSDIGYQLMFDALYHQLKD